MKSEKTKGESKHLLPGKLFVITIAIVILILVTIGVFYYNELYEIASRFISVASLIIAILTLAATVAIAIYVYNKQKRDGEAERAKRRNTALKFFGIALEDAVKWAIRVSFLRDIGPGYRLKEYLNRYEDEIADILSHDELLELAKFTETIDVAIHTKEEDEDVSFSFIYKDWISVIMASDYRVYAMFAMNVFELLNKQMYSLLQRFEIPGTKEDYQELQKIRCSNGSILFKRTNVFPDEPQIFVNSVYDIFEDEEFLSAFSDYKFERTYRKQLDFDKSVKYTYIFDGREQLVAVGELTDDGMKSGFVRSYRNYTGMVADFQREGMGIEYDKQGNKLKEGYWSNDKFVSGIEYNWVLRDEEQSLHWNPDTSESECDMESELQLLIQYDEGSYLGKLNLIEGQIQDEGIEYYYICDIKTLGERKPVLYFNIRRLDDFLKRNNLSVLKTLLGAYD